MTLISVCTVSILLVLVYGVQRQRRIEYIDGSYRIVPANGALFGFVAILVIVSTLRYGFIDTYAYKEMYRLSDRNWNYIFTGAGWGIEEGWLFLNYILNYISSSPKLILFLSALIINIAFAKTCRDYSEQVLVSLFIYFCLMYMDTNNGMRQMVATAIVMLAMPYLEKKKYIRYICCVILAYLLHNSAIVCIPIMVAVIGKPFNWKTKLALAVGLLFLVMPGAVTSYLSRLFEDNQYNYYLNMRGGMTIWRALVTGIVPLILTIMYGIRQKNHGIKVCQSEALLLNTTIINSMFVLMGMYMLYWNRMAFYTFYAPIAMIPKMARVVFGDRNYFKVVKPVIFLLYFLYFIYNIYCNVLYGALDQFVVEWWC